MTPAPVAVGRSISTVAVNFEASLLKEIES